MDIVFITCILVLLYTFIGYPVVLKVLTFKKATNNDQNEFELPELTVLLCIYNGADKLKGRIDNILSNGYPVELIHIIVVSDGSTDNPHLVINSLTYKNIDFMHYDDNKGKSFALNEGLKMAATDIIAFADIRQTFAVGTLEKLALCFNDLKVGAASGNLNILKDTGNLESDPGLYWQYEKWIRKKESAFYSLLGVTGAVYMARRELIPTIPEGILLDDMYVPLSMVKLGHKIKFVENAIAYDKSSSSIKEEFNRKVRTLAGNFQLMSKLPWLVNPVSNPVFFQFLSHKVMRLLIPYALILLFLISLYSEGWFYSLTTAAQALFYLYSYISYELIKKNKGLPFSSLCVSFCSLNLAAFVAGWKYYFSATSKLWKSH
jgi:cellulose synthase/poly-beta-1,6-N-acetylglucosamine synthase-like glycosyltransferase